jgi:hypothetical protein
MNLSAQHLAGAVSALDAIFELPRYPRATKPEKLLEAEAVSA